MPPLSAKEKGFPLSFVILSSFCIFPRSNHRRNRSQRQPVVVSPSSAPPPSMPALIVAFFSLRPTGSRRDKEGGRRTGATRKRHECRIIENDTPLFFLPFRPMPSRVLGWLSRKEGGRGGEINRGEGTTMQPSPFSPYLTSQTPSTTPLNPTELPMAGK